MPYRECLAEGCPHVASDYCPQHTPSPQGEDHEAPDVGLELEAVAVAREAQNEMLVRVLNLVRSLPAKGKYPPDQIVSIIEHWIGPAQNFASDCHEPDGS